MSATFGARARRHWHAAATILAWRPAEFWSATPVELASALAPADADCEPFGREQLKALESLFPDQREETRHG